MAKTQTKEKTSEEIEFDILLDEIDIAKNSFKKEMALRMHKIEGRQELLKHNILVAEHDLKQDIAGGVRQMQKAADAIILPEDVV